MARCVLRVFGIRLAAKGWCGPGGRGCAPCGHVPASRAAASLVERSASGGLASGRRPVPQGPSRTGALRRASRFLRMQKCAGLKCQLIDTQALSFTRLQTTPNELIQKQLNS